MADLFNYVQAQKFTLAGSGATSSATSITVTAFNLPDGTAITQAMFGTTGFGVNEPGTVREETISWTGVTANGDGTSTLTGVVRGLNFISPYTTATARGKTHAGGSIFVISNPAAFYNNLVAKNNDESIAGKYSFAQNPETSAGDPTGANDFARKSYVDGVSGGSTTKDSTVIAGTAGATLAAGDIIFLDSSDQEWKLTDADTATSVNAVQLGIAQGSGADAGAISGGVLIEGRDTTQTGMTPGADQFVSNTAGDLAESAGTTELFVGIAETATVLLVDFRRNSIPTADEHDAIGGTTGVVSSTNKLVSDDNVFEDNADQEQTTNNGIVEVGEADTASNKNDLAQSFIPTRTKMRGAQLHKEADSGTFTGTVSIALQLDSSGDPSGSDLASVTITNADWLLLADDTAFNAIFSTEFGSVIAGNLYWIVITTSTADNTNHPNVGTNTAGGYSDGSVKFNNTTDGWTAIATIDLTFKTLNGKVDQVVSTNENSVISGVLKVPAVTVFTATGTYTKSDNISYVVVEVVGGGGGGDGQASGDHSEAGGGGGGYSRETIAASSLAPTETVTVGAGGDGGATATAGGTTSFGTTILIQATGGSPAVTTVPGAGGIGSLGDLNVGGGDGGVPLDNASGAQGGGNGGSSVLGGGGAGANQAGGSTGEAGNVFGGGGGGGSNNSGSGLGGGGAAGVVIVTEHF